MNTEEWLLFNKGNQIESTSFTFGSDESLIARIKENNDRLTIEYTDNRIKIIFRLSTTIIPGKTQKNPQIKHKNTIQNPLPLHLQPWKKKFVPQPIKAHQEQLKKSQESSEKPWKPTENQKTSNESNKRLKYLRRITKKPKQKQLKITKYLKNVQKKKPEIKKPTKEKNTYLCYSIQPISEEKTYKKQKYLEKEINKNTQNIHKNKKTQNSDQNCHNPKKNQITNTLQTKNYTKIKSIPLKTPKTQYKLSKNTNKNELPKNSQPNYQKTTKKQTENLFKPKTQTQNNTKTKKVILKCTKQHANNTKTTFKAEKNVKKRLSKAINSKNSKKSSQKPEITTLNIQTINKTTQVKKTKTKPRKTKKIIENRNKNYETQNKSKAHIKTKQSKKTINPHGWGNHKEYG